MDRRSASGLASASLIAIALAIVLVPASASARGVPRPRGVGVRLEYERTSAARRCPDEKALRAEVAAEMGYDPFVEAGPWRMRIAITRAKNGKFAATAELFDGDGAMSLDMGKTDSFNCRAVVLTSSAAWAAFVLTDPPPEPEPPPKPEPVLAPVPEPVPEPVPVPVPVPVPSPPPVLPPLPPPKRAYRIAVGADAIFAPFIAPSASAGFGLWAGIDLLDVPLSFELDLRAAWSLAPAHIPLTYQPQFTLRTAYVSGVLAGCWRKWAFVSLCPVLEVGRISASRADTIGEALHPGIVVAAGLRGVYSRPIGESLFLRALFEIEGVPQPFSIVGYKGREEATASPISLTWGAGFGGTL